MGLLPEFLEKPVLWFTENEHEIRKALVTQPRWESRTALLEAGKKLPLFSLLRKLDELGYEKVLEVTRYGEFAHRGGIVDIFPVNLEHAVRIEFAGNNIEALEELSITSDLSRKEWLRVRVRTQPDELEELKKGEYVVHLDHGIGRYHGRDKLQDTPNQSLRSGAGRAINKNEDYLVIEYAQGDKLFVPEEIAARKISRYIGFQEPSVGRLGGFGWLHTKRKIREETEKLARELLTLYAERTVAQRPPVHFDPEILAQFAHSFVFDETPDQIKAWGDILKDLSSPHPMDRLIAGDVGFGKTEVALRAAAAFVSAGLQATLLSPTTVLADQHFLTAKERMEAIGIKVALLSRLQTKSETQRILNGITRGTVDVIIGTHRILSKDVLFQNLGLLIIDEEQRFGVKQKERFKQLRSSLDILSLTATPIPRTLSLILSGARSVSRIATPPPGRQVIETTVVKWNEELVKKALAHEFERGGQTYVLHNRIGTMEPFVKMLRALAPPAARIGTIHGRMPEKELIATMRALRAGTIDILVSTTIIENGLDLGSANTLIVEDATKLGLAQAWQLRGRIGRREIKAYAYFLYPGENPTETAQKRLEALEEAAQEIGAGGKLARRDLEIRGAGNILGREQSGFANRVGLNLYFQMLAEAVERLRSH